MVRRMDLSWANVWTVAATTGIFTTVLNQGLGWSRELWASKRRKNTEARYLVMRIAVLLEEFVIRCLNRAWHDDAELSEGGRSLGYNLPPLAPYPPDSGDWKSFHDHDPKLADQVLSFPNQITSAELSCQFQGMHEGNAVASADETIVAGVNAWTLAQALRSKYHLEAVIIDHVDFLEKAYEKIKQQRTDWAKRSQFNVGSPVP